MWIYCCHSFMLQAKGHQDSPFPARGTPSCARLRRLAANLGQGGGGSQLERIMPWLLGVLYIETSATPPLMPAGTRKGNNALEGWESSSLNARLFCQDGNLLLLNPCVPSD